MGGLLFETPIDGWVDKVRCALSCTRTRVAWRRLLARWETPRRAFLWLCAAARRASLTGAPACCSRLLQEHLDELPWLVRVTAAHAQYVMFGSVGILCLMSVVLLAQMAPHAAVWRQEREEAEREERAKKEG